MLPTARELAQQAQQDAQLAKQENRLIQQRADQAEREAQLAKQENQLIQQRSIKLAQKLQELGVNPDELQLTDDRPPIFRCTICHSLAVHPQRSSVRNDS